ncbi:purine catabolism regulator [Cytobacillus eiseniae]|uniref:Purine catabolism regulator n=1 Tax=Cytobacillus eiseniae TaxID=762947 RepID=A0ABS4RAD3_9BACI|nr:PucR family transcriptional regulator [Cytobacillus eiseniae]MBP2239841.1 purine catabolism regulator [Cytobacillus eiseniae]
MKSYLTVKDILQRKHFDHIEVIAGTEGLNRLVKWVHVVEVTNIRNLLNGYELILTTGVAWRENKDSFISIVHQLIDSQAAGLCIEIGTYTSLIPQEIIDIANKFHFPVILFHKEVPFVAITQDIHTLLINQQYRIISDLEEYSQSLNKKLLKIEHYNDILKCIQHYLHVQVIIHFSNNDFQFTPEMNEHDKHILLEKIEGLQAQENFTSIASIPIQLLGDDYAELIIFSANRSLTEFDQLILDRTATALAQFFLRELYVEEKRRVEEAEWLNSWLLGEQSEDSIKEFITFHSPAVKPIGAVVCLYQLDSNRTYTSLDLTYMKIYFRSIFEQKGFTLFAIEKRNTIIFIFLNERTPSTWKIRIEEGISRLKSSESQSGKLQENLVIGIGKYVEQLSTIHKSYQTAAETLRIQRKLSNKQDTHFYDDLHIFRLISQINHHLDLKEMVLEYLEPVFAYDKKYNGKLIETLKIYLSCNGSKQETAKKLYIVRQTLYHRIEKLEKLLGDDFMNPEKRLAIEFMILAYEFLESSNRVGMINRD